MANRFHKLKNNDSDFPILDNVNVYQYDNDFDYSRYIPEQMKIQMCTVPWDMGEAHIGNRTISGIGNVVYFGSAANRDAWFAAIPDDECFRFATKYKELHRDNYIDVPVPFDVCAKYNYIAVEYELFANDDSPVMYESADGVRKWFWFIREVEFLAANNTRLHILDDAFQTWIYDVNVSGMILERGHAPMFSMKADDFLQNPVENNGYLLTEDVNFGDASVVKHVDALALNAGDMYACIATTANPRDTWGAKDTNNWKVPVSSAYQVNGQPSVFVFALPASELNGFLADVNSLVPQFRQTVQGVFFASASLITLGDSFQFAGTTCHMVNSSRKSFDLCELGKGLFGYGANYADIAKLYTSPYAHIEITDENGNVDIVKIEDTTGNIDVSAALSLAYPFITIDAHLLGVGGSAGASVTYRNISAHTFDISGQWYETVRSWNVPTFAVILSPALEYDYSTHFDRAQRVIAYTADYDNSSASAMTSKANADATASSAKANADASASTTKANADAKASTSKANADASADTAAGNAYTISGANKNNADANADTLVDNADAQRAGNLSIQSESATRAQDDAYYTNALSQALQAWESGYARDTANNQIDAAYASAAIGAAGGAISSAVSGGMSGASAGPAGAVAGAIGGLIGGAIGGATSMAQTAVAANLTSWQAEATVTLSQQKVDETSNNNVDRTSNQNLGNYNNTVTTNDVIDTTATNSAATMKANATRTRTAERGAADATQTTEKANNTRSYNTETANNARSYNTDIANNARTYDTETASNQRTYDTAIANAGRNRSKAQSGIANDVSQAALKAPFIFGEFANGESAANKPIALFAHIVTQSKSAISSAGDEFLRYGYAFDKQWEFNGNWNVGKYFTYWKLRDFWVSNLNVPDMYMDKLRFFLYGGVTVWRNPSDIGKRTIYENFNG